MGYHYDPILCMNVPDSTSKAKDAKPLSKMDMNELRALYVSLGGDIKRTYGTSKQAMILKIDDLKRKGKDVPQGSLDRAIDENYIVSGMKSQLGQMLKRYKDPKNRNQLVSQYIGIVNNHRVNGKVTEEEFNEFVKYAKGLVGGSHDALSKAIRTADAENERWITMNGSHVKIDGDGNAVAGNEKVKSIINSKKKSETAGKSEKKQAEGSKKETYKSYSDFKKNSGAEDLLQFVDEVAFDAGHDEKDPDKEDLKRIGKEFQDVYEKIKDHPNAGEYVNKMRREINNMIEEAVGTSLYDYSYLGIKELNDTLKIFNKYYD